MSAAAITSLLGHLEERERFVPAPYLDIFGYPTVGYGQKLEEVRYAKPGVTPAEGFLPHSKFVEKYGGQTITRDAALAKAKVELQKVVDAAARLGFKTTEALALFGDLAYQVGSAGAAKFSNAITACKAYEAALIESKDESVPKAKAAKAKAATAAAATVAAIAKSLNCKQTPRRVVHRCLTFLKDIRSAHGVEFVPGRAALAAFEQIVTSHAGDLQCGGVNVLLSETLSLTE